MSYVGVFCESDEEISSSNCSSARYWFFSPVYSLYVNREAFCHPQIPGFEVELGDADV